jgi:hypothetical protein
MFYRALVDTMNWVKTLSSSCTTYKCVYKRISAGTSGYNDILQGRDAETVENFEGCENCCVFLKGICVTSHIRHM